MVAFLEKSTESDGFHQVIDFLNHSHISCALTKKPAVYVSFIKQFWRTAEVSTDTDGMVTITASIYGHSKTLTEASLRRHLKLEDHDGLTSLPNLEIFEYLQLHLHLHLHHLESHHHHHPHLNLHLIIFHLLNLPPIPIAPYYSQPSCAVGHVFTPHESPLHAVHSHESDEVSLKLQELTNLVSQLSARIGVLETDLKKTKLIYSSAFTKLILRVKKLETQVKSGKARRKAKYVLFEDEDIQDDSYKQGRMSFDDHQEGVEWIPDKETKVHDKEVQEKASDETELVVQDETPTEVLQDQESSEKGQSTVSTAGAVGTASEVPQMVSTAEERVSTAEVDISTAGRVVYSRRNSRVTRQDKGKGIMTEPESKNKSKKELEQERLSLAEAIRIQEQIDEDQRAQIARDEEIAKQWQEQERIEQERVESEGLTTKEIDWNDPSIQSYNEIRPIFEKVWKFNNESKPMDSDKLSERISKKKSQEEIVKDDADTELENEKEQTEQVVEEVSKVSTGKRKKSFSRRKTKKQRVELDDEPEELKELLDIVPREDIAVEVESLSTKYLIVDWKTIMMTENFMYYQIIRGDGSSKNYKILSEMLDDFDRQDVIDLYNLVKERYRSSKPEGWTLCEFCGVHILLMENGIAIHMLTEKKYPLSQEMLSRMLSRRYLNKVSYIVVLDSSKTAYALQSKEEDHSLGFTSVRVWRFGWSFGGVKMVRLEGRLEEGDRWWMVVRLEEGGRSRTRLSQLILHLSIFGNSLR
ncbi:hypothetical protein Tco_0001513 [Tanacetum coccineum]